MQKSHYFIGMPTHQPQFIIRQTQKKSSKEPGLPHLQQARRSPRPAKSIAFLPGPKSEKC